MLYMLTKIKNFCRKTLLPRRRRAFSSYCINSWYNSWITTRASEKKYFQESFWHVPEWAKPEWLGSYEIKWCRHLLLRLIEVMLTNTWGLYIQRSLRQLALSDQHTLFYCTKLHFAVTLIIMASDTQTLTAIVVQYCIEIQQLLVQFNIYSIDDLAWDLLISMPLHIMQQWQMANTDSPDYLTISITNLWLISFQLCHEFLNSFSLLGVETGLNMLLVNSV